MLKSNQFIKPDAKLSKQSFQLVNPSAKVGHKSRQKAVIRTKTLVYVGMFVALISVVSQFSIPTPGVPLTMQMFVIALAGYMLGWKYGLFAVFIYLLVGATGMPVFSNFTGGVSRFVDVTGGFLWGFLPMVLIIGLSKNKNNLIISILFGMIGLVICHSLGVLQFSLVTSTDIKTAFLVVSLPYLVKDVVCVLIALFIKKTLDIRNQGITIGG